MNPSAITEMKFAEEPTLEWLQELGWNHLPGERLSPSHQGSPRTREREVMLVEELRSSIARLNPKLPAETVTRALELALVSTNPSILLDHRDFHQLLLEGVPVTWLDEDGGEQHHRAKLLDFDTPGNNTFTAVNQLTIVIGKKHRIPDVLLFVNGLPLGQIELKNPAAERATAETAVHQVGHYLGTIPELYRYVEIVGVSDLGTARVGTITTPAEHFSEWKTMDPAKGKGKTQLELMLRGVFAPDRLLAMVRDYVIFETSGSKLTKVMAKYHQVDAVDRAVDATAAAMAGDKRAGVVWHTTGSGKSWTMVFYATRLRRDPRFSNPTLVFVTDRNNLDDQLSENFTRATHLGASVAQAEEISGSDDSLHSLLSRSSGKIVFTTIQKFRDEHGETPKLSDRANVVVISDEAHRTQYGRLAQNLGKALPNAVRVGFTGTPIETADKSTRLTFGDYISVYSLARAQEDHATVPIYYESRRVPLAADEELVEEVAEILDREDDESATAAISKKARLAALIAAEPRLTAVADDIATHFAKRCEQQPGKAMVVCYRRATACRVTDLLRERLGEDAVECVITASADDKPIISKYRKSKKDLTDLAVEFRKPDTDLRIVVVENMWLTGFDAPVLHTLYVDKPMANHGLLQAIARVNRVFGDKPGGLVVDYIGIGDDLRKSLRAYSDADVQDAAVSLSTAVAGMIEKHGVLRDLLYGLDWQIPSGAPATVQATKLINYRDAAIELLLAEERSQDFLDTHAAFRRWYSLAAASPEATQLREDKGFFDVVVKELRQVSPAAPGSASPAAEQAVEQFFSEGLAAGEVVDVFALADKDRPEISVLSDEFLDHIAAKDDTPNLQVRLLQKLLNDELSSRLRSNAIQAKEFRSEINKLIASYESKLVSSAQIVEALVEVARELRAARRRNEALGLTVEEAAFYDALAGYSTDAAADPAIAEIAQELVREIRKDLAVDWTRRDSAEAGIRRTVKQLLRRKRFKPKGVGAAGAASDSAGGGRVDIDRITDLVLLQAKTLYHRWPDVEADRTS